MRRCFLIASFLIFILPVMAQDVPIHYTYKNIYEFIDELANNQLVNINSMVKPYSRSQVFSLLNQADTMRYKLNKRQTRELDFYLKIYKFDVPGIANPYSSYAKLNAFNKTSPFSTGINPPGLFYKDSKVTFALKPILGLRYYLNDYDNVRHTWGGLDAYLTVGKHWGIYANIRENNMTDLLASETSFAQREGGKYKINQEGINAVTYSEMRGGITYQWEWGSLGFVKDQLQWGLNYNGPNIFSGRTPSFPMLKLDLYPVKWLEFHYYHGWLNSEVIDSSRSYTTTNGDFRAIYRNKYIAANLYTFKLWPRLHFSFGNSIIYSDANVQPAYLIPFLFYKSVDHTLNYGIDNQNSQMYFALSSRLINHTHLYGNIFIDDFSVKRISDKERHNFAGTKVGLRISNWPLKNVIVSAEYTRTNPIVYKHRVPTLTFESNRYNLGHYLRDNSKEWYFALQIKPFQRAHFTISYLNAEHGNEYQYLDGKEAEYFDFLSDVTWSNQAFGLDFLYEIFADTYLQINFQHSETKGFNVDGKTPQYYLDLYTPKYLQGIKNTLMLGINVGF